MGRGRGGGSAGEGARGRSAGEGARGRFRGDLSRPIKMGAHARRGRGGGFAVTYPDREKWETGSLEKRITSKPGHLKTGSLENRVTSKPGHEGWCTRGGGRVRVWVGGWARRI